MNFIPAKDKLATALCYETTTPPLHHSTTPPLHLSLLLYSCTPELLSPELAPPARKRIVRHSCRQNFPSVQRC